MKNEIQAMPLRKIKWMMTIRLISLLLAVLFIILTITISFDQSVSHLFGSGLVLAILICVVLALASCAACLVLSKRLASGGL